MKILRELIGVIIGGVQMEKNFSIKNRTGYKPVKKYKNFILFEKEVNGIKFYESFHYNELPELTKEDKLWIEKN